MSRAIFDHALSSVVPHQAVINAITIERLTAPHIYAVAIGKAAAAMAKGLDEALGQRLTGGVISAPAAFESKRWQSFIGGHPLPNQASLDVIRIVFSKNSAI